MRRAAAPATLVVALALAVVASWAISNQGANTTARSVEQQPIASECLTAASVANVWCEPADPVQRSADGDAPVISLARRISATSDDGGPVAVVFTAVAADPDDGIIRPTCVPAPGTQFPIGTTMVSCTAVDSDGNVSIGRLEIVVSQEGERAVAAAEETSPTVNTPSNDRTLWLLASASVLLGALLLVLGERRRNRKASQRVIDVRRSTQEHAQSSPVGLSQ